MLAKILNTAHLEKFYFLLPSLFTCILADLAFAPNHLTHFVWFAPLGLIYIAEHCRDDYKKLVKAGAITAILFCFISFRWMTHLFIVFGNLPAVLAYLVFIIYAVVFNLKFPLFLVLYSILRFRFKQGVILSGAFSGLFTDFFSLQIFPWYWGSLAAGNIFLAQTAEYFSIYGLSFLVFLVSGTLYLCCEKIFVKKETPSIALMRSISGSIAIFGLFFVLGIYLFYKWQNAPISGSKNILMIQPNGPLEFRDGRSIRETMEDLMLRIEKLAMDGARELKPDLIVLPESGVPFFSAHKIDATQLFAPSYWDRFESLVFLLARKNSANVFFNEVDAFFKDSIPRRTNLRFYNNSVLYDPAGERKEHYRKSYLLAFGEYIPFGETFEVLYSIVPQIGRFIPGESQNLIPMYRLQSPIVAPKKEISWKDTSEIHFESLKKLYANPSQARVEESGRLLPLICYEVIIPEFVRKFSKAGHPDIIVNITNDKWYGISKETFQHLELGRIRSIEYRRWMVRSTNSGTSAYVDHLGRIVGNRFTGQETSEFYPMTVPVISSDATFYMKYGNLLNYIILLALSFCIVYNYKKKAE